MRRVAINSLIQASANGSEEIWSQRSDSVCNLINLLFNLSVKLPFNSEGNVIWSPSSISYMPSKQDPDAGKAMLGSRFRSVLHIQSQMLMQPCGMLRDTQGKSEDWQTSPFFSRNPFWFPQSELSRVVQLFCIDKAWRILTHGMIKYVGMTQDPS